MRLKNNKKLICFGIEMLFALISFSFLYYMKNMYSFGGLFEEKIFVIICLLEAVLLWGFGAFWNKILLLVFNGAFAFYLVAQKVYYRAFGQYFRLSILSLYKEGLESTASAQAFIEREDIFVFFFLLALTAVFIGFYFTVQRKTFVSGKRFLGYAFAFLFLLPIPSVYKGYTSLIEETRHQEDSFQLNKTDFYIYETVPTTNRFVEKFSLLPLLVRDIEYSFEKEVFTRKDYERVTQFLNARPPHEENAMTGIFKDKNLLVVLAESLNDISIDETLTPTLWKMKHQGIQIEGFNTSTMTGSTSASEFMANTSVIPLADGDAVCYRYPFNSYETTLPSMFKEAGYLTRAHHNNYGEFYNRDVLMPEWGYDYFYDCTELGLENLSADSQVMEVLKWTLSGGEGKYMDFWISYSGHQPYGLESVAVAPENVARIIEKYPELDDEFTAYFAKNMDFDQSLATLLENLEEAGKAEDWVIIVFGDHYAKQLDTGPDSPFFTQTGQKSYSQSANTDLFIYHPGSEPLNYPKTSTLLDLLPTVANLWDMKVDYRHMLGRDIFDPSYGGYHFGEWDFVSTDNYVCDVAIENCEAWPGQTLPENWQEEVNYFLEMNDISRLILKLDYFAEK